MAARGRGGGLSSASPPREVLMSTWFENFKEDCKVEQDARDAGLEIQDHARYINKLLLMLERKTQGDSV